jgi:hypothetical protein
VGLLIGTFLKKKKILDVIISSIQRHHSAPGPVGWKNILYIPYIENGVCIFSYTLILDSLFIHSFF